MQTSMPFADTDAIALHDRRGGLLVARGCAIGGRSTQRWSSRRAFIGRLRQQTQIAAKHVENRHKPIGVLFLAENLLVEELEYVKLSGARAVPVAHFHQV